MRISALRSKKRWRGGRSECCASASKVAARRHPGPGRTQEPVQKTINNMEQRVPPEHWRDGPTARPQADPARSWLRSSPPPSVQRPPSICIRTATSALTRPCLHEMKPVQHCQAVALACFYRPWRAVPARPETQSARHERERASEERGCLWR